MSGLFGAITNGGNISETVFYGTDYHSHLGTGFGGMAIMGDTVNRKIHSIERAQFKAKFYRVYNKMAGNKGIGTISSYGEQPIHLNSKFGPFCVCFDGLITNAKELAAELHENGISFSEISEGEVNPTELVAKLITQGETIMDGIELMRRKIRGSCSLLLMGSEGIYAARDKFGYSPLVIGKKDGAWAVATESGAFSNLGFELKKFIEPGEIVLLDNKGMHQLKQGDGVKQVNSFLWIYTGFPSSNYESINVELVRERCGMSLARGDDVRADMVAGVPDSGTAHAVGYAIESGIPFRRPLVKYTPGYGRSYTPPSQRTRDLIAKMKLIPNKDIIDGKRIILCDDSIVRGTQLKSYTLQKLWSNGVKEVHLRISCPPLMFPSRFDFSTKTIDELAARRAIEAMEGKDAKDISEYLDPNSKSYKEMVDHICRELRATSLKYLTIDEMVKAIGMPKEDLCLYVWNGEHSGYSECG